MKKIFSLLFALTTILAVNAKQVVFDFSSTEFLSSMDKEFVAPDSAKAYVLSGKSFDVDGITIGFTKGSTDTRIWNGGSVKGYDLRVYKNGGTITLAVQGEDVINSVVAEGAKLNFTELIAGAWTSAEGVKTLTLTATETCQVSKLTVTLNEVVETKDPIAATCAEALTAGAALAAGASTEDVYAVTGYVTETLSAVSNGQQSFWIADTKEGGHGIQSYYCSVEEAVLVGDKVTLTGKLTKYHKDGQDDIIEIKNGTTAFLEKVERGQNPPVDVPDVKEGSLLTCAEAQAYALSLASGTTSEYTVLVEGYITKLGGEPSRNQQTIWMADEATAEGIVQGYWTNIPDGKEAFTVGEHIYLVGKLMNYNGTAEIKNGDVEYSLYETVEFDITSGTATYVNSASELSFSFKTTKGDLELEDYNHSSANAIAGEYDLAGFFSSTLGETDLEKAAGKLTVTYKSNNCYDVKFVATLENTKYVASGSCIALGEYTADNNNITCAKATQICEALAADEQTATVYNIYGYVVSVKDAYSDQYKNETFYISDDKTATTGFYCFRCSGTEAVAVGDFVCVSAKLVNYKGNTPETVQSGSKYEKADENNHPELLDAEEEKIETINVAKALEIGQALNNTSVGTEVTTTVKYRVRGYCTGVKTEYSEQYGNETWYMGDVLGEKGDLQIYRGSVSGPIAEGDFVEVVGFITNYCGESETSGVYNNIQIKSGKAEKADPQGINDVVSTTSAVKAIINGQLVIIREGAIYTITGARL